MQIEKVRENGEGGVARAHVRAYAFNVNVYVHACVLACMRVLT